MRTVRQPTIRTWFVFAILFAIPLSLPLAKLEENLAANGPSLPKAVFALGASLPWAVALSIVLIIKSPVRIAALCIILRVLWLVAVLYVDSSNRQPNNLLFGLAASVWPEWWAAVQVERLKLHIEPDWILPLLFGVLASILYAFAALVLAATCRLAQK